MKTASKSMFVAAIGLLLAVAACSTPSKVRVDKDASANFAGYKTFVWFSVPGDATAESKPAEAADAQKQPAEPQAPKPVDSITQNRVRDAISSTLQGKGYSLVEGNADFKVSYALSVFDRPKKSGVSIGVGAGGGSGNVSGGVGMSIPIGKRTETAAVMTIDIIDAARNSQVWTGTYDQRLRGDVLSEVEANEIVNTILARFPADSGAK